MQSKIKNFKTWSLSFLVLLVSLFFVEPAIAQEIGVIDTTGTVKGKEIEMPILKNEKLVLRPGIRQKIEGINAVVGDYMVLYTDIDKAILEMQAADISTDDISRCDLLAKLMEDKLYAHHASIDTTMTLDEDRIHAYMAQQIEYLVTNMGSEEAVVSYYQKQSMDALKEELFNYHKINELARMMQTSVVDDIEVTPEEVRQFFYAIPKDERPYIGTEVEMAHIVFEPKISKENKQEIIDRLNEMRTDVIEGNSSFSTLAVLYSKDGSRSTGGLLPPLRRDSPYVKEFKDHAFSLKKEGDISEPFESEFGYHIIQLEKIIGQEIQVRHILLFPEVSQAAINEARALADSVRTEILEGRITFADAARTYSDEQETKTNGGQLYNPETLDPRFDLNRLDPELNSQIYNLEEGEITSVISDRDQYGKSFYKILKLTKRFEEHQADYQLDYTKIKDLALQKKQIEELDKWRREKVKETYIHIHEDYKSCKLENNWLNQVN